MNLQFWNYTLKYSSRQGDLISKTPLYLKGEAFSAILRLTILKYFLGGWFRFSVNFFENSLLLRYKDICRKLFLGPVGFLGPWKRIKFSLYLNSKRFWTKVVINRTQVTKNCLKKTVKNIFLRRLPFWFKAVSQLCRNFAKHVMELYSLKWPHVLALKLRLKFPFL